ncbi:MAG: hypothetical protein B7Y80_04810 [Hyphomicrobium sp. 32-62-53]|nr:MAG: hypothetical protein B7Y80_04810 [Hyphomicrobium sp. 32-62-53]
MLQLALPFPASPAEPKPPPPELRRFLGRLPPELASRLTPEEHAAFAAALAPQRSPHWLDLKASLPIPGFGIYIALMVGRERRNPERLRQEGQRALAPNLLVGCILLATVIAGWVAAMLLIKALQMFADHGNPAWWHAYTGAL